jgi:hypothetical protein
MVLINAGRNKPLRRHSRRGSFSREKLPALGLVGFAIVFVTIVFYQSIQLFPNSANNLEKISKKDQQKFFQKFTGRGDSHPNLRSLDLEDARNAENADFFDSIANDIIQTLDCDTLLEQQTPVWRNGDYVYGAKEEILRRKLLLEEEVEETEPRDDDTADDPAGEQGVYLDTRDRPDRNMFDDDPNGLKKEYGLVTGAHLFCLAAYPRSETAFWNDKIQCKVYEKQKEILDLDGNFGSSCLAAYPSTGDGTVHNAHGENVVRLVISPRRWNDIHDGKSERSTQESTCRQLWRCGRSRRQSRSQETVRRRWKWIGIHSIRRRHLVSRDRNRIHRSRIDQLVTTEHELDL